VFGGKEIDANADDKLALHDYFSLVNNALLLISHNATYLGGLVGNFESMTLRALRYYADRYADNPQRHAERIILALFRLAAFNHREDMEYGSIGTDSVNFMLTRGVLIWKRP